MIELRDNNDSTSNTSNNNLNTNQPNSSQTSTNNELLRIINEIPTNIDTFTPIQHSI